jgi:HEAT repeat protein
MPVEVFMRCTFPVLLFLLAAPGFFLAGGCGSEALSKIENLSNFPTVENCRMHMADADPGVRLLATLILASRPVEGKESIEALTEALSDRSPQVRLAAASALSRTGEAAASSIPYLLDRLHDRSEGIRIAATGALANVSRGEPEVLSRLQRILFDAREDYGIRVAALLALGRLAGRGVPELKRIAKKLGSELGRKEVLMRHGAAYLDMQASGRTAEMVTYFLERLGDENVWVRLVAAQVLGEAGEAARKAKKPLLEALSDPSDLVVAEAARALGRIGADPDVAVPALLDVVYSEKVLHLTTTLVAAETVATFRSGALPYLMKKLDSFETVDRFWAVFILGEIGPEAAPAAPAIRRLFQSRFEDEHVLLAAEIALKRVKSSK